MPIRFRRVTPLPLAAAAAVVGIAVVGWVYATSPAPPDAEFVKRLTARPGLVTVAALAGMLAAIWGVGGVLAGAWWLRRNRQFDEIARQLSLERVTKASDLTDPGLGALFVLRSSMNAVLHGKLEGTDVVLGSYTIGSEPSYATAVACFRLPRELPSFALSPEGKLDLLEALGVQHLDFQSHPAFSKSYRMHFSDEAATRRLFDRPAVLDRLMADTGWYVESSGSWLALYRREEVGVSQLPQFVQRAMPLFKAFAAG